MLSPSTSATLSSPMKSAPMTKACASPSGEGWVAYEIEMPNCEPSPSSRSKPGRSCGVVITSTSRMPAKISVESG